MYYFISPSCNFIHSLNPCMFDGGTVINEGIGFYFKRIIICGNVVCVKVIQKQAPSLNFEKIKTIILNINHLIVISYLNHPNILKLYAIYEDLDNIYIVFENPLYSLTDKYPSSEQYIVNHITIPLIDIINNIFINSSIKIKGIKITDLYFIQNDILKINLYSNVVLYDKLFQTNTNNILYDIGVIMFEILEKFSPYSREARMFIADCTRSTIKEIINHQWIINNKIHNTGFRRSLSMPIIPKTIDNSLQDRISISPPQSSSPLGLSPQNTNLSDITSKKLYGFKLLKKIFNKK